MAKVSFTVNCCCCNIYQLSNVANLWTMYSSVQLQSQAKSPLHQHRAVWLFGFVTIQSQNNHNCFSIFQVVSTDVYTILGFICSHSNIQATAKHTIRPSALFKQLSLSHFCFILTPVIFQSSMTFITLSR